MLETFTISELSFSVMTISGALSGILLMCWKSRCVNINVCWGCLNCEREVLEESKLYKSRGEPTGEERL